MSLFLDYEEYQLVKLADKYPIIPILGLVRKGYYSYFVNNLILPIEKDKIYKLFNQYTSESRKKVKRMTISSQDEVDKLRNRCVIYEKISYEERILKFQHMIPSIEIIEWPRNTLLAEITFNSITKNKYTGEIVGTYMVPILSHSTPTSVCKLGCLDLDKKNICICKTINGCCCGTVCKCSEVCMCDDYSAVISGNKSLFYLSDLETREIMSDERRIMMYIHVSYA